MTDETTGVVSIEEAETAKKVTKKKVAKKKAVEIPCADCGSKNICKAQGWCKRG